ncbi:hypothetical protein SO694_00027162 [Aureococcus anophagefferens]|uniref:J domain-containing protein n=2 Tax=Aureococcus anophagefferens TaxID=44056 RepID=A0ABR1FUS2_AURAN
MSLMGPGAMTEYEAPSRGRRARGTVYVDDPAVGFFVAGSSLRDMNGIYTRKDCAVPGFRVAMSYAHSGKNGWCMALCAEQRERKPKPTAVAKRKPPKIPGGDDSDWETEESEEELSPEEEEDDDDDDAAYLWRLVDPTFRSRFTHKGDTLIPGAGTRWTAVGDAGAVGSGECFGGGDQMVEGRSEEEVEDELPWQIIALLDAGITRDLLRSAAWREHKIRVAASGEELPTLPARSLEALLGGRTYGAGADAALVEECWLYTAVAGCALRPAVGSRRRVGAVNAGDYLRVVERRSDGGGDLWLKVDDGDGDVAWLPAADAAPVPAGDVASAAPPEEPDPEIEAAFDRPFEARLEGDEETTVVEAEEEDDDDAEADAPREEAPVVAQRARDLNVGDRCVLHSLLGSGFGLEGSVGTVVKARSADGRYEIAVDGAEGAKRRVVSVKARNVHSVDAVADGEPSAEAVLLGVDPRDLVPSKGCVVDFAARASERDAAFDARLESDPAGDDADKIQFARERLLEAYGGETGMHATLPAAVLDASPLDLVAGGCCGVRAADAATRGAADDSVDEAFRGCRTLQQVIADEAARLTDLPVPRARARHAEEGDDGGRAAGRGGRLGREDGSRALRRCTRSANFKTKGDDAYARGDFGAAVDRYTDAVEAAAAEDPTFRAVCLSNRAACRRRKRDLEGALADVDAALALFPTYARARFRRACTLLELDRPAVDAFVDVYRHDRDWPDLCDWLVRAEARERRRKAPFYEKDDAAASPKAPPRAATDDEILDETKHVDLYTVLGVSADATEAILKRAYRLRSLKYHPDKKGGSTFAFQRVREAFDTLSDPEKRRAYDLGEDIKKPAKGGDSESEYSDEEKPSLREEIERKYYPERYEFYPFGDPFTAKRKMRAKRERMKSRKPAPAWYETY